MALMRTVGVACVALVAAFCLSPGLGLIVASVIGHYPAKPYRFGLFWYGRWSWTAYSMRLFGWHRPILWACEEAPVTQPGGNSLPAPPQNAACPGAHARYVVGYMV